MPANPADVMAELQLIGLGSSPEVDNRYQPGVEDGFRDEIAVIPEELASIISESRKTLNNLWSAMETISKSVTNLLEQLDDADVLFKKLQEDIGDPEGGK